MALGTVTLLLAAVGVVALLSTLLALVYRIPWRLALRNVRRGRWRTVLVVLGLLVGTTIVSGSLTVGDTVTAVSVHYAYQAYGYTDEGVYNASPGAGYPFFPYAAYQQIANASAGDPQILGIAPEVLGEVQAFDLTSGLPQPGLDLIAANASQTTALGPFSSDGGGSLAGPGPGQVYLDDQAAGDLNAQVGDSIELYGASNGTGHYLVPVTVAALVHDDVRGGFLGGGNAFVDLAAGQALEGVSGEVNFLAVTNAGSLTGGVALSSSVAAHLNATVATLHPNYGLSATTLLADALSQAVQSSSSLTTLFLVLGLFSIIAGAMLIVGIFVMLAEERKSELGMLRAVGLPLRQLVLTYYFEGLVYSVGSAAAGALLGVGVGYVLAYTYATVFAAGTTAGAAILSSFTVTTQSIVLGYVIGFLLTLATVTGASAYASRLNIVRAIRGIPEPTPSYRTYTWIAVLGAALLGIGLLIVRATYQGSGDESTPLAGGALVILGAGLILARFLPDRLVFSATGVGLLLWGGYPPLHRDLFGAAHTGTIFAFFVEGIFMVVGAIVLYTFNGPTIVRALTRVVSRRQRSVPVARIGLSYPARRGFRTSINLTIFAMVLFTVVGVASFGASVQADLNSLIQAESGGYTFVGSSSTPVPDLAGAVSGNATLAPLLTQVVGLVAGGGLLTLPDGTTQPYPIVAAPSVAPGNTNFYTTNRFNFSSTLDGMTAAAVWSELQTNASVAVVDGSFESSFTNLGSSGPTLSVGAPITLTDRATGNTTRVTVIGILSQSFVSGVWVAPGLARSLGYAGEDLFFLTTAPGVDPVHAAQELKLAFFAYGLVLYDFAQILQSSIASTEALIGLLEVFVALGLAVGIAAMGIVALRAVVERRAEIGMLRANGFTRGMVFRAFLLEYSYVALVGIAIGTVLAIVLIYDASTSPMNNLLQFDIPWANVAEVIGVAYLLVVLAILAPSIRAAQLPPASAIRYSE